LLGVQEVPSSNLGSPTKLLKELRMVRLFRAAFWSPSGVHIRLQVDAGTPLVTVLIR
jgi:hypothetical protein